MDEMEQMKNALCSLIYGLSDLLIKAQYDINDLISRVNTLEDTVYALRQNEDDN